MRTFTQILLCLLPLATICAVGPFAKYSPDTLQGRWYVQNIFESGDVEDYKTTQCSYIDFNTAKKTAINTTWANFGPTSDPDSTWSEVYLPSKNGSAIFADEYDDASEAYPLEVIDVSSLQPWQQNKAFAVTIIAIKDIEPDYNGIAAVYAISKQKNAPLSADAFMNVLKALNVEKEGLNSEYIMSMNNAKC